MSTTPKVGSYGEVRWTGHFYQGFNGPRNSKGQMYLMVYEIIGVADSKHVRDVVDGVQVTNGTCDGKGWDVVLFGEVVEHEKYKRDAQSVAEGMI